MDAQHIIALRRAFDAVSAACAAGFLPWSEHPWHVPAGANPAEEALDRGDFTPEQAKAWCATMAAALQSAAPGRGVVTMTEAERRGW